MTNLDKPLKVFIIECDLKSYFKRFIKIYGFIFLFIILIAIRFYLGTSNYKYLFICLMLTFTIISFIIGILKSYIIYLNLKYKFYDSYIEVIKNDKSFIYELINLIIIDRPIKNEKKYGVEFIKLIFKDNKSIKLSHEMPAYYEIKKYVIPYLKRRVNYTLLLTDEGS